jgi:hypothetical protein
MSRSPLWLTAGLLTATCACSATAALYKWTDAQGRTVYSDQPPIANVKTEQLRPPPPPANPNAAKELAQREADFRKRQTESVESAAKSEKDRGEGAKRAEACAQAKGQLKQLTESQLAIYRYNEKGEREVMDDDARGRERAKLNTFVRDNKC